jgi:hypothetical protein
VPWKLFEKKASPPLAPQKKGKLSEDASFAMQSSPAIPFDWDGYEWSEEARGRKGSLLQGATRD